MEKNYPNFREHVHEEVMKHHRNEKYTSKNMGIQEYVEKYYEKNAG